MTARLEPPTYCLPIGAGKLPGAANQDSPLRGRPVPGRVTRF